MDHDVAAFEFEVGTACGHEQVFRCSDGDGLGDAGHRDRFVGGNVGFALWLCRLILPVAVRSLMPVSVLGFVR